MFERILVLTDGSPCAALAFPYAADLARTYSSQLTVLYVVPEERYPFASAEGLVAAYDPEAAQAEAMDEGTRILEQARSVLNMSGLKVPGANFVRLESHGQSVAEVVADEVRVLAAGLVVMATHGRSGLAHLLMGSVAERVLQRVGVPVFMVNASKVSASALRVGAEVAASQKAASEKTVTETAISAAQGRS